MIYQFASCYTIAIVLLIVKSVIATRICTPYAGCFIGGVMSTASGDILFDAFLGVPYAKKAARFEEAVPYTGFKDVDCTQPAPDCINKNYLVPSYPVSGAEDCLYLNIYTTADKKQALYPVMVYIFGGGFFTGTASPIIAGPEYLMEQDKIVVVTINYRLGAFGFLSTADGIIPGNLGLKDQLCALKWIQQNIAFFGGNQFEVTIFGHGSGAVSAHLLLLSPLSRGLFHNVIAMSGTANAPYAIDENPEGTARETAKYCKIPNWDTINSTELKNELMKINVYELLDAGDHLKYWDVDFLFNYRPVVELPFATAVISRHPIELLRTGSYSSLPIMFGRVPNEGGIRAVAILESDFLRTEFNKDFYNLIVSFLGLHFSFNDSQIKEKMEYILDAYFNNTAELNAYTASGFVDLITDWLFLNPLYNAIKMIVETTDTNEHPVYLYEFDYRGPNTYADIYAGHKTKLDYRVIHSDDLIYLFRAPYRFDDFIIPSNNWNTVQYFTEDLVTFTTFGPKMSRSMNPCNIENIKSTLDTMCEYEYYVKGKDGSSNLKVSNEFFKQRMTFWDFIAAGKPNVC
ncbi:juvenile hormone esterase-like isoform 2-T2 [Cochliomyia hominivorax]